MARSQNSFIKKQKAERKRKKKQEKFEKRLEKSKQSTSGDLDDMIAYVDEFGNITNEPPEEDAPEQRKEKQEKRPQQGKQAVKKFEEKYNRAKN